MTVAMQAGIVPNDTKIRWLKQPGPLNTGANANPASTIWSTYSIAVKVHHDFTFEVFCGVIDFPSDMPCGPRKRVSCHDIHWCSNSCIQKDFIRSRCDECTYSRSEPLLS